MIKSEFELILAEELEKIMDERIPEIQTPGGGRIRFCFGDPVPFGERVTKVKGDDGNEKAF